jgi:hypothetical protein
MLDRLVEVFCAVEDFCQTFQPQWEAYQIDGGYQIGVNGVLQAQFLLHCSDLKPKLCRHAERYLR